MSGVNFLALLMLGATLIHSSRAIKCYHCESGCDDPYSGPEKDQRECPRGLNVCTKRKGEFTRCKDSATFLPNTNSSWSKRYDTVAYSARGRWGDGAHPSDRIFWIIFHWSYRRVNPDVIPM